MAQLRHGKPPIVCFFSNDDSSTHASGSNARDLKVSASIADWASILLNEQCPEEPIDFDEQSQVVPATIELDMASVAEGLQEHLDHGTTTFMAGPDGLDHQPESVHQLPPGQLNVEGLVPGHPPAALTLFPEEIVCLAAQAQDLQQSRHAVPNLLPGVDGQLLSCSPKTGCAGCSWVRSDVPQHLVSSGWENSRSHCAVEPPAGRLGALYGTGVPCAAIDAVSMVPVGDTAEGAAALGCLPSKLPSFAAVVQQAPINMSLSRKSVNTAYHAVPNWAKQPQPSAFQRRACAVNKCEMFLPSLKAPGAENASSITSSNMPATSAAASADRTASAVAAQRCRLFSPTVRSRAEAVARYRAKRATRCAVSLVRYHKRKQYAENRPRVGGRFVKASSVAITAAHV